MDKHYTFVSAFVIIFFHLTQMSNGTDQVIEDFVQEFESRISQEAYRTKHEAALESINQINSQADASKRRLTNSNERYSIDELQKGYINSIKCIAVAGDQAYQGNQDAQEQSYSESAIQRIVQANTEAKEGLFIAQIAVFKKLGLATARTGTYAAQQLRESTKYITIAGQATTSGLDEARTLSIIGIQSGGPAKSQSLKASNEAIEATGAVYYNKLLVSATIAFGGVDRSISAVSDNTTAANEAAKRSPEAMSIIQAVRRLAISTKNRVSSGSFDNAVDLVRDGFVFAIKLIALAIEKHQAVRRSDLPSVSSRQQIEKATEQTKYDIAYAAAFAHQNLATVEYRTGVDLNEAVKEVEAGCSAAFKSLEVAGFSVLRGLDNGNAAIQTGQTAAGDAVLNSAFVSYARFLTAANIAFDVLST